MRRNVGNIARITPLNGSLSDSRKKPHRNRGRKPTTLSRPALVALLITLAVAFLLGVHLFLFQEINSKNNRSDNPGRIASEVVNPDEIKTISVTNLRDVDLELYTIRINTWKRDEQLLVSIEHHSKCPGVAQIQVVWCDDRDPPKELESYPNVVVERHAVNSLNERFHILEETPTMGILSIDDDVMRPCEAIDSGFFKWTKNPDRMVGFDARTHVVKDNGTWKYGYMSTTDKTNKYSLSLPRYCFIHRDYLRSYMTNLPRPIFAHVAQVFNCEDIAMSFWISRMTEGRPPLLADQWSMKTMVKFYSPETISGSQDHKALRDACVNDFAQQLGLKGILQKATVVHHDHPLFESGAEGNKEPPANWRLVNRNAELEKMVQRWRHLSNDKVLSEVSKLRSHAIRHAYVLGLIEGTSPWKQRWHK